MIEAQHSPSCPANMRPWRGRCACGFERDRRLKQIREAVERDSGVSFEDAYADRRWLLNEYDRLQRQTNNDVLERRAFYWAYKVGQAHPEDDEFIITSWDDYRAAFPGSPA